MLANYKWFEPEGTGGAALGESRMMRVLVADDDAKFRGLVKRLLEGKPEVVVVGEAGDGEEAVRLAQQLEADMVVMDVSMPRLDGLQATRRILAERPQTKVILLTVHDEEAYRLAGIESGAEAFIVKKNLLSELFHEGSFPHRQGGAQPPKRPGTDPRSEAGELRNKRGKSQT